MPKFTFAHLIGRKAKATEDDDEKTRKAKGRRAEDDDEEESAENDDPESEEQDDEEKGRKAKKAKSKKADDDEEDPDAEEDEEAEDDDDDNKDVKKGRRAEQKRCAQIFGSKAAAGRADMAAHLAFNTSLSASEAISTLKAMGSASAQQSNSRSLDARMREEQQVRLGQDAAQAPNGSAAALVQKMTGLYNNKGGK